MATREITDEQAELVRELIHKAKCVFSALASGFCMEPISYASEGSAYLDDLSSLLGLEEE